MRLFGLQERLAVFRDEELVNANGMYRAISASFELPIEFCFG